MLCRGSGGDIKGEDDFVCCSNPCTQICQSVHSWGRCEVKDQNLPVPGGGVSHPLCLLQCSQSSYVEGDSSVKKYLFLYNVSIM